MDKYYDCIDTEVKVGDSVVYADDELGLHIGEIKIDNSSITPTFYISNDSGEYVRRYQEEICYITTLDELGE